MRIVITRHGETDWNVKKLLQGQADIALNENGRTQAGELAKAVSGLGIAHVYPSDLSRATETGRIVADILGVLHTPDARLRECSFGTLDGLPYAEVRAVDAGSPQNRPEWPDPLAFDYTPYGGENGRTLFDRQHAALRDYHAKHGDDTIMIVGHGRSLRTLLFGLERKIIHLKNCQHHIIEFNPNGRQ